MSFLREMRHTIPLDDVDDLYDNEIDIDNESERRKEIKRRRHRRKKLKLFARKLTKATVSETAVIADKLRSLTPGGEVLIERWDLEKR